MSGSEQVQRGGSPGDTDAAFADLISGFGSATTRLLQPGSPFELREEEVLGQPMQVFAARDRNFRQLLDPSCGFGDAEFLVFDGGPRGDIRRIP